jgi:hypothetical protein
MVDLLYLFIFLTSLIIENNFSLFFKNSKTNRIVFSLSVILILILVYINFDN